MSKSILYNFSPDELQNLLDISNGYADVLRKVNLNPKGRNPETLKKIIKEYNLDETKLKENRSNLFRQNAIKTKCKASIQLKDILSGKIQYNNSNRLLKKLVKEGYKKMKCEICGITKWMGKEITMHLHHIDGNHTNNNLKNLQVLCPNCHSQTENFAGRNVNKNNNKNKKVSVNKKTIIKLPPITKEELSKRIMVDSFVSIAKDYNVSDNTVRKWCDKYGLPRRKKDIKLKNK